MIFSGEHPRYSQYKNLTKAAEQQAKRREETLERQKNGRFDTFMKLRNLAFDDVTSDEDDEQKIETTTAEKHTGKFKK